MSTPNFLRIESVLDTGEVVYRQATLREIQKLSQDENPFLKRKTSYQMKSDNQDALLDMNDTPWRYSFHPRSIFIRFAGLSLPRTAFLFPFMKQIECSHTFGCFEQLLRKMAKSATFLLIIQGASSVFFNCDIYKKFDELLRSNSVCSDKQVDFAFFGL